MYTRNPTTGVSTTLFYEDNKGNQITGTVIESCCTCNTLCDVPLINLNRICFSYGGSFNGDGQFPQEKATTGANMFIEYFEVDGNVIVSSQTSIGNTGSATFSDMGYGIGYDSVINLLNNSILSSHDLEFTTSNHIVDRGWGIKYNDAKSYRIVLSDSMPISGAIAFWTIVINPTEQWDGIGNALPTNSWTQLDFGNSAFNFQSCVSL